MPQKSAPELFAVVHYLHRLSTEGKRGAKMALESCPKCHFIMLEGVLMTIEEHGQNGTIYVSDLAAAVKQPLPAVSRALRQLEQDGLIERITDPNDRRKTLVRPTEKGLDASRQVEAAISRYFERVICRIPEEQREQLFSLTGVLLEAVEAENAEQQVKFSSSWPATGPPALPWWLCCSCRPTATFPCRITRARSWTPASSRAALKVPCRRPCAKAHWMPSRF